MSTIGVFRSPLPRLISDCVKLSSTRATFGALFIIVCLSGCFAVGSARLPKASDGYQPAGSYAFSVDQLWPTLQDVLAGERITVAASNKADGTLTTDYVQGQTQVVALGLLGAQTTRYRYNVRLSRVDSARTKITIIATLESSGSSASQWHDVSKDNPEIVASIERALYEKLERAIQVSAR